MNLFTAKNIIIFIIAALILTPFLYFALRQNDSEQLGSFQLLSSEQIAKIEECQKNTTASDWLGILKNRKRELTAIEKSLLEKALIDYFSRPRIFEDYDRIAALWEEAGLTPGGLDALYKDEESYLKAVGYENIAAPASRKEITCFGDFGEKTKPIRTKECLARHEKSGYADVPGANEICYNICQIAQKYEQDPALFDKEILSGEWSADLLELKIQYSFRIGFAYFLRGFSSALEVCQKITDATIRENCRQEVERIRKAQESDSKTLNAIRTVICSAVSI